MVRQFRTGKYGQAIAVQQPQEEEVTPEAIRDEPRIPEGRFGRGLKVTEGLRERARQISNIRNEAIAEAQRLEDEFFSQRITTAQAEQEYANVDPRVRQFIKTTPQVRRQMALKVLSDINTVIASNESAIINLQQRGGSEAEFEILEKQQTIYELTQLRDEAESGAFTFQDLISVAEAKARSRRKNVEQRTRIRTVNAQSFTPQMLSQTRAKTTEELVAEGIPLDIASQITSGQPIDLEEFYRLPKNIREQTGLSRKDFESESLDVRQVQLFKNTPFVYGEKFQRVIKGLSGETFAEAQAKAKGFKEGTPEFEKSVRLNLEGLNLQIAVLSSIAGVPRLPKIARVPTRAIRLPKVVETQQEVIINAGKRATLSQFDITTEVKAPSKLVDFTKGSGILGKPKVLKNFPREVRLTKTVLPVVNEGKVLTLTSGKGAKSFTVEVLRGASTKISPQQIKNLSKTQRFLFGRATGSRVPTSTKNIEKLLGKKSDLRLGFIEKTKLGKISRPVNLKKLEEQMLGLKIRGKSKTRFELVSKLKPFGKSKEFNVFKGKLYFKDITKSTARASGRTPIMNQLIRVARKPKFIKTITDIKFPSSTDVKILQPSGRIKKTPLSLAFPKQELKLVAKPIIKLPKLRQVKALKSISGMKLNGKLNVLGGSIGRVINGARGSNRFDFTRGIQDFTRSKASAKGETKTFQIARPKQINLQLPRNDLKSINRSLPKFAQKDITKLLERQTLKLNQKNLPKLSLKTISKGTSRGNYGRPLIRNPSKSFKKLIPISSKFKLRPLKLSKKRRLRFGEDFALVESFTARELGLRPQRIRAKDIGKALARQQNIANIRLRPIIISNNARRKRRRR